jgi:hypothetical protein
MRGWIYTGCVEGENVEIFMHEHHENNEADPGEFSESCRVTEGEGIYLLLHPGRYGVVCVNFSAGLITIYTYIKE